MKAKMVLVKYKEMKILVSENCDLSLFTANTKQIDQLYQAAIDLSQNLLTATEHDVDKVKQLKAELNDFILASHVIGFPFDNHDAELFALDRKIEYDVLVLQDEK